MATRLLAAALVVGLLALPAAAQVTPGDLDEAQARLATLREELLELTIAYENALTRDAELESSITALEVRLEARRLEASELRARLESRLVEMYTDAAEVGIAVLFAADEPTDVETRSQYLRDIGVTDRELLNELEVLNIRLDAETRDLETVRAEHQAAIAELEVIADDLNSRLEAAQAEYNTLYAQFLEEERRRQEEARRRAEEEARRRAEEEARRRAEEEATRQATTPTTVGSTESTEAAPETTTTTVAVTPTSSSRVCPVNGFVTFTDTWGAPRSGGRFHRGVDMLAARGTPVVAIGSGVVLRMRNGGLGGITVWLKTDNGDEFYYAHLDAWASGLSAGQRVGPGDLLGTVGTTGNAPSHIPHLHWEYHPGGGGARNPTPLASQLCG